MKKKILSFALIACSLLTFAPSAAMAKTMSHPDANISFSIPDSWSDSIDGSTLVLTSPDNLVSMVFFTVAAADFDALMQEVDSAFSNVMSDVEYAGDPKEISLNGYDAIVLNGTGNTSDTGVEWEAIVLMADQPVVILSFGAEGGFQKHQQVFDKLVKSIKPAS